MEDERYQKLKHVAIYLIIATCAILLFASAFYAIPKLVILTLPFIIGYIISLIVRPLVKLMHKYLHFPNKLAAVIALIFTVGVLGSALYFLINAIINQFINLYQHWPQIYKSIMDSYSPLATRISAYYATLNTQTQEIITSAAQNAAKQLTAIIQPATRFASDFAKSLPGVLIFTVVMVMSAYFMSADKRMMPDLLKKLLPDKIYYRVKNAKNQIVHAVGGYFKAQLIIMCVVFIILSVSLTIVGIHYSFLVALGIAALDALPIFGSGTILIPWSIISLIGGNYRVAISLVVIYLIIILTRQLIEPKIVSKQIGLHPLATLLAMYIGLKLFSVIGLILGPVLVLITVNFIRSYREQSTISNPSHPIDGGESEA